MSKEQTTIKLRPLLGYWITKYLIVILIDIVLLFMYFIDMDIIYHYLFMVSFIVVWLLLCYTYVDMLFATAWEITDEVILFRRGVFSRRIDYLELYRIVDYSDSQSFLQILLHNKTVKLISGDSSHSTLYIYGISNSYSLIPVLRERVELARKSKGIYEITNRL